MTRDVSTVPAVDYAGPGTPQASRVYYGLTMQAWTRIGLIALALIAVFWPNLRRLWLKTNFITGEANWQHAPLVPLIGLYYLYLNREKLLKAPLRPILWNPFFRTGRLGVGLGLVAAGLAGAWVLRSNGLLAGAAQSLTAFGLFIVLLDWGLGTMLFGLLAFGYGIWPGQNDFIKDIGMVITVFGVVTLLCGWDVMKIAWFPIVFLVAAIPWPQLAYSWIAMPLQEAAATAAVATLKVSGVDALRDGTRLVIGMGSNEQILNVAEQCAGLKSLMSFVTLAAAIGFLSSRPLWQKLTISFSAVPIAIFCNMLRVSGQGLLHHYVSKEWSEGFAHQFVGLVLLIPAFALIMGIAWIIDNLYVDEVDRRYAADDKAARKADSLVIEVTGPAAKATAGASPAAAPASDLAAATQRLMTASLRKRPSQASGSSSRSEGA